MLSVRNQIESIKTGARVGITAPVKIDDCSHEEIQRERGRVAWMTPESEEAMLGGVCDYSNDTINHTFLQC